MKLQSAAHSEETTFNVNLDNSDLVFSFGDANTHAGQFVFEAGVTGQLKHGWSYPSTSSKAFELRRRYYNEYSSTQGAMMIQ